MSEILQHIEVLEDLLISVRNHLRSETEEVEIKRFKMREKSLEFAINKLKEKI